MHDITDDLGPAIAVEPDSNRARLQSADVLLADHPTRESGVRWLGRVFDRYPGCSIAVARHEDGRWWLITIRGDGRVHTCRSGAEPATRAVVERLVEGIYLRAVSRT
ncbi:hypothetical protein [Amycolatopsis aidingensis]|uniref:hypothetical protein n=1 Tax=Amycolatopsis aidingensis TaxID=2842453 RepID=UPI001C0D33FE|nr:hypothetical protein [Amycolatopsis aidingensis]